ncbi:MAG: SH3 domain-containing protein [Saprospiraceae bacterium]
MRTLFFLAVCTLTACQNTVENTDSPPLAVRYPTELREHPDEKSRTLSHLPVGTALTDRGETSRFLAAVFLENSLSREPWLRVHTTSGQTGWVFAGTVEPRLRDAEARQRWLHKKRTQAMFGAAASARLWNWATSPHPTTDTAFAGHLRTGLYLRDTLDRALTHAVSRETEQMPADLSWLREPMRYFWIQDRLSLDFRLVAQAAAHTAGQQDDQFAAVGLAAFPLDSIESALPAWVFPLSIEASCSNLGAGLHVAILEKIDSALHLGSLFRPELMRMKDQILADILDNSRTYWQPRNKVLTELDRILATRFACLTDRDRLALTTRRVMLARSGEGGIRVNVRSGR